MARCVSLQRSSLTSADVDAVLVHRDAQLEVLGLCAGRGPLREGEGAPALWQQRADEVHRVHRHCPRREGEKEERKEEGRRERQSLFLSFSCWLGGKRLRAVGAQPLMIQREKGRDLLWPTAVRGGQEKEAETAVPSSLSLSLFSSSKP